MPNGDRMRLGLLGCGDVAQRDYLPEFHRLAGRAELTAVCGKTLTRATEVAEQYGISEVYDDYARMLAESDIDAVINLTPIQLHGETTLAALRAGKHVYSEKPAAASLAEALTLCDEAAQRGLTMVCAPVVLLFPQVRHAAALVRDGTIGPVTSVIGRGYGGVPPWSGYPSYPGPFFARGGGPLIDMGVYPLHAITGILGPARRVSAFASHIQESFTIGDGPYAGQEVPVETEDNWHLLLDFGDGRLASVTANNVVRDVRAPQMEVSGLAGTVSVDLLDVAAPLEIMLPGEGWMPTTAPHERSGGPDHLLGVEHLVECVQTGARPIPNIEHAAHVIEIMAAAAESARSGKAVVLTTTFPEHLTS